MVTPIFTIGPNEDAKNIRIEVFVKEQGFQEEFDDLDARSWSLTLYLNNEAIATGRIVELDPETYLIGRVAVRKEFRGQKVGTYTVKFLMTKIKTLGGRKAVLHSQLDKVHFYETLGFKSNPNGEVFYEQGYPHMEMTKVLSKPKKH